MDKEHNKSVDFSVFMEELEKRRLHADERTAALSIEAAKKAGDVVAFYDRKQAKQVVMDTFPELPEEKAGDVGMMLHLVVKDLKEKDGTIEKEPDKP